MRGATNMMGACANGRRHPRLRPLPHPLAPHSRPQPPAAPRRLPSDPAVTHDPQGNRLPTIDDISGFCGGLVEWAPCRCDPWDMWGWSSVIFQVRRYTPANLWMNETDWRDLVRFEFARPGYLRAGLRPRTRSILDRRRLLAQPQPQC